MADKSNESSLELIEKLSGLAMIELTDQEVPRAVAQINAMKKAFEIIGKKTTAGIEPLFVPNAKMTLREDKIENWEARTKVLEQAPEIQGSLIKVPLVIG